MQIVVLDGHTLNPGDLSWAGLHELGQCHIHDRTSSDDIVRRAQEAEVILTNKTQLSKETISQLPKLRYIGVLATGYNVVDVKAAHKQNICVTNIPAYGTVSVAQMVFAHLLNLTQHVAEHWQSVQAGTWSRSRDFCYWNFPLVELKDLTMGIIGLGRIGQTTARLALGFGMKVIYFDVEKSITPQLNAQAVDLDTLFKESDVVSLHCPLTDSNYRLVNEQRLQLMKPTAFLINTSRGPLIDEKALAEALNAGKIAGAGLDVLGQEPPEADDPLSKAKNCYITPHIAWATKAARWRLMDIALTNIRAFVNGKPQNAVTT